MRFKMSGIEFGKTKEGNTVTKYLLKNKNGMEVAVMDLGATIVSVLVPDKNGLKRDVVLGYDTPQEYQEHTCYFGAVIGRNANMANVLTNGTFPQVESPAAIPVIFASAIPQSIWRSGNAFLKIPVLVAAARSASSTTRFSFSFPSSANALP